MVSTVYHVTARGWERRVIVRDDRDREKWFTPLDRIVVRFEWQIIAWVPMDNHVHPVFQTPKADLSTGRPACTTWTRTTPRGSIDDIDVLGHSRDDSRRFWSLLPRGQTTSWSHLGFRKDQRLLSYKSRPDPMSLPGHCCPADKRRAGPIYPGYAAGSENSSYGWGSRITLDSALAQDTSTPNRQYGLARDTLRYLAFSDPSYELQQFDFENDVDRLALLAEILNANNADLSAFKAHGGTLLLYHTRADHAIPARASIEYHNEVVDAMGGVENVGDFFRFYLLPGVTHCAAGPGLDTVDWLATVISWVEEESAPDALVASGGDRRFSSLDIVAALQTASYMEGPRAAIGDDAPTLVKRAVETETRDALLASPDENSMLQ